MAMTSMKRSLFVAGCVLGMWLCVASGVMAQDKLPTFETPQAAVRALLDAMRADDLKQMENLLGKSFLDRLPEGEKEAHQRRKATALELAQERIVVEFTDETKTRGIIVIGNNNFRAPLPLIKTATGWTFDVEAGLAEIAKRRVR